MWVLSDKLVTSAPPQSGRTKRFASSAQWCTLGSARRGRLAPSPSHVPGGPVALIETLRSKRLSRLQFVMYRLQASQEFCERAQVRVLNHVHLSSHIIEIRKDGLTFLGS